MGLKERLAVLGPGLLYAGAAIGVSHLVQSTRAGAEFGFQLVALVVVVNIIKYPIFEAGPRYAASTGKTLLDGYKAIGNWAVWVYMAMSIFTMFIVMAAISIVTAGLFSQLLGIDVPSTYLAILLLIASMCILGIGKYDALDKAMKFIIVLLTLSTLGALAFALFEPDEKQIEWMQVFDPSNRSHVLFLVAFIGWMPAPVDISIWHSLWSVSKNDALGRRLSLHQALTDFRIGYWGTTLLAVCFVMLGALIMYGTPDELASDSVGFAGQLIEMYTLSLGPWAFPLIALAAATTMFSTLLTCLDAFPRTLRKSAYLLMKLPDSKRYHNGVYWFWLLLTAIGTSIILLFFLEDMRSMVDVATSISFVLAPVLAILNFMALQRREVSKDFALPQWLKICSLLSIALLSLFSICYLVYV